MLNHINLNVADYERSKEFYRTVLAPLGYRLAQESLSGAGFAIDFIPDFRIKAGAPVIGSGEDEALAAGCVGGAVHVAFASPDRATVDAFCRAALAAGVLDHDAPRLHPEYHPNYYGAFIIDPNGYNIEAVCHHAE